MWRERNEDNAKERFQMRSEKLFEFIMIKQLVTAQSKKILSKK